MEVLEAINPLTFVVNMCHCVNHGTYMTCYCHEMGESCQFCAECPQRPH